MPKQKCNKEKKGTGRIFLNVAKNSACPLFFMEQAYQESIKGLGKTRPNPVVGAAVVKNGKVISKGAHLRAGGAHAEVIALSNAGKRAKGADLYVTLEPCSTFGRTPPCADKIINSGIKRVFIGAKDPNPAHNGRGIYALRKSGIKVKTGFLEKQIKDSNRIFFKYITKKIPFVTVKVAQSLDGKIATHRRDSKWITSQRSRALAHKLRKEFDAVITGTNTVIVDNPRFEEARLRIIIDSKLRTPAKAKIFSSGKAIIATTKLAPKTRMSLFRKKAEILICPLKDGKVDLLFLLKELAQHEISSVLVEAGGELVGSFFDNNLVDRVLFFIAPKIIGGKDAIAAVAGKGISKIKDIFRLKEYEVLQVQDDLLVGGYF